MYIGVKLTWAGLFRGWRSPVSFTKHAQKNFIKHQRHWEHECYESVDERWTSQTNLVCQNVSFFPILFKHQKNLSNYKNQDVEQRYLTSLFLICYRKYFQLIMHCFINDCSFIGLISNLWSQMALVSPLNIFRSILLIFRKESISSEKKYSQFYYIDNTFFCQ